MPRSSTNYGFQLTGETKPGDIRGHTNYTDTIVNVDPTYPLAEQVHILVHELGHIRCGHHHRRDIPGNAAQRETEAESVAYIVRTVLGLGLGDTSALYVGGWTDGNPEIITVAQAATYEAALTALGRPCG